MRTLADIKKNVNRKEYSNVEVIQCFLDRIHKYNKIQNSFISINAQAALSKASKFDDVNDNDHSGLLSGIPIAHKDIFCCRNAFTTCGSKLLAYFKPDIDANLVSMIRRQGAVIVGKTNMDAFGIGSSNETSAFGVVRNPWNSDYVAGGSSGGSAAAVAAGLIPAATGSDAGGSIRQPASYCNATGLKPTFSAKSSTGMISFTKTLDQPGFIARTAEDCAYLLESTSALPNESNLAYLNTDINKMMIGLPKEYFNDQLDTQVGDAINNVIQAYEKLGVQFKSVSLAHANLVVPVFYILAALETAETLADQYNVEVSERTLNYAEFISAYGDLQGMYDDYIAELPNAIRSHIQNNSSQFHGNHNKIDSSLENLLQQIANDQTSKALLMRLLMGTYILKHEQSEIIQKKLWSARLSIVSDFNQVWQSVDAVITPTTLTTAFKIGAKEIMSNSMYQSDYFTASANLAGLPALSAPAGFIDGMPIGYQLIGPRNSSRRLLNFAHKLQQITNWHHIQPKLNG